MSLQSCSLVQELEIQSLLTRNLLSSVNPGFEFTIDSQSQESSLDTYTIHQFLRVSLDQFLRNKFFSILQILGNSLLDFLGRVCSSFPILHSNSSFLFEPEKPIHSPEKAVIVEIRVLD